MLKLFPLTHEIWHCYRIIILFLFKYICVTCFLDLQSSFTVSEQEYMFLNGLFLLLLVYSVIHFTMILYSYCSYMGSLDVSRLTTHPQSVFKIRSFKVKLYFTYKLKIREWAWGKTDLTV